MTRLLVALLAFLNIAVFVTSESNAVYMGCYARGALRFENLVAESGQFTRESCKAGCEEALFRYFGMSQGSRCLCGSQLRTSQVSTEECRVPCSRDSTQLCGGAEQQLSVYRSGVPDDEVFEEPSPRPPVTTQAPTTQAPTTTTERVTRPPTTTNEVSDGSRYLGCFRERSYSDRLFKGDFQRFDTTNSHEVCIAHCEGLGFDYSGVQFGRECFCSNEGPGPEWLAESENDCNRTCPGNREQMCGSWLRMGVFRRDQVEEPITEVETNNEPINSEQDTQESINGEESYNEEAVSTAIASPGYSLDNNYIGCFLEHGEGTGRSLQEYRPSDSVQMTREHCRAACEEQGHKYFGVQNWVECFCGNAIHNNQTNEEECSSRCAGDNQQVCGGFWRVSIYRTAIPDQLEEKENNDADATAIASPSYSLDNNYIGCFLEHGDGTGRSLQEYRPSDSVQMTREHCRAACEEQGHKYFGVQNWVECFCGNVIHNNQTKEEECSSRCAGDNQQVCGGFWRVSIYRTAIPDQLEEKENNDADTTAIASPSYSLDNNYIGCFLEHGDGTGRSLQEYRPSDSVQMTREHCRAACEEHGHKYFGVQNWVQCFCGNTIRNNMAIESECKTPCAGDHNEICGGSWRVSIYRTSIQ